MVKACIFISHNVGQIYRIAHRFIILDRGRVVDACRRQDITLSELNGRLLHIHSYGVN